MHEADPRLVEVLSDATPSAALASVRAADAARLVATAARSPIPLDELDSEPSSAHSHRRCCIEVCPRTRRLRQALVPRNRPLASRVYDTTTSALADLGVVVASPLR